MEINGLNSHNTLIKYDDNEQILRKIPNLEKYLKCELYQNNKILKSILIGNIKKQRQFSLKFENKNLQQMTCH